MGSVSKRRARGEVAEASAEPRTNIYDDVTAKIIAELEAGRFPWVQPWGKAGTATTGLPRNALTGRSYSGVNVLILWGAVIGNAFPSQCWLTFRQAQDAGGCVRKGEKGTTVVYADRFVPKGEAERAQRADEEARAVPFLKRFTVFNVSQCEGLRAGLAPDPVPLPEREIVPIAEALIKASNADFRMRSGRRRSDERTRSESVATPSLVRSATRLEVAHCSSRVSSIRTTRSDVFATSASSALVSVVLPVEVPPATRMLALSATPRRSAAACIRDMIPRST